MKKFTIVLFLILLSGCGKPLWAEVVDSSFYGFTVRQEAVINAPPDSVYDRTVRDIGRWWDSEHTYSGNAANLSISLSGEGCFCERLPGGGVVRHMTVIYNDPGKILRLSGGLGPLQSMAVTGTMTFIYKRANSGTSLTVLYSVGGYAPVGLAKIAVLVDQVLGQQVMRLKSYVENLALKEETEKPKVVK